MEFLYTAYSVFKAGAFVRCVNTYNATKQNLFYLWLQVIKTDFTAQNWSETNSHYTVVVEAAIDNKSHEDDLPLAPWY